MATNQSILLEQKASFTIHFLMDKNWIIFKWKPLLDCTEQDYKEALKRIAFYCQEKQPAVILIDKSDFSPSIAVDRTWWRENILPIYHQTGLKGLGHINGIKQGTVVHLTPVPGLHFKMATFPDLAMALNWKP